MECIHVPVSELPGQSATKHWQEKELQAGFASNGSMKYIQGISEDGWGE